MQMKKSEARALLREATGLLNRLQAIAESFADDPPGMMSPLYFFSLDQSLRFARDGFGTIKNYVAAERKPTAKQ
jgi:hypothetical protein